MKKTIITMVIALVAMVAPAETYSYLKFTRTDNSTVTYSVEGLKLTYDNTSVTISNVDGTATLPLAQVQAMEFTNDASTTPSIEVGDVNKDGTVSIADVTDLIDYLLTDGATDIDADAADIDKDGEISISDITALVDYLLAYSD
jgi:hypothetical protein